MKAHLQKLKKGIWGYIFYGFLHSENNFSSSKVIFSQSVENIVSLHFVLLLSSRCLSDTCSSVDDMLLVNGGLSLEALESSVSEIPP